MANNGGVDFAQVDGFTTPVDFQPRDYIGGRGGFYFTDFGKIRPRDEDLGGLYYALQDGSEITEIAYPLSAPNGVGLSPDGSRIYVS